MNESIPPKEESKSLDFVRAIVDRDLKSGKHQKIVTRFPPEPNGYLHIGHAKSICLNFGIAKEYGGVCHLRFDDTNPSKEDVEYVESIQRDVRWLGFDWLDKQFNASDYFEQMYEYAEQLVKEGKAYVDSQNEEDIRLNRGTVKQAGVTSPDRDRPADESLDLLRRMRAGEFKDGEYVLRAKINMAAENMKMRDPIVYRIRHQRHHNTGDKWCIYPMYDFAHCLSDMIEGITHSICTLEFEVNRPLYDWFLDELDTPCHPQQIEFARLNLTHTVMSKRMLLELVKGGYVNGWDDPRMPTVSAMRRRGYTPEAIRNFCEKIGVSKFNSTISFSLLEFCLREDLNKRASRYMGVLDPLKIVIENYPEGQEEEFECVNNPEDPSAGSRKVPFSRELYIEREDFMEDPPKKFFRLAPGREVRLRYAYFVTCREAVKDSSGKITELRCTYDPESQGGQSPDGRKVKATIHWVSAKHAIPAEVRLYEHLFTAEDPLDIEEGVDYKDGLNPESLQILENCPVEPALAEVPVGQTVQFERKGYFCPDPDSKPGRPVFNRTITLRDSWAKVQKSGKGK